MFFRSGFLVFNTCEERAKAVTFLTPIIQKIGARLQMKSYFRPTAAMANVSGECAAQLQVPSLDFIPV